MKECEAAGPAGPCLPLMITKDYSKFMISFNLFLERSREGRLVKYNISYKAKRLFVLRLLRFNHLMTNCSNNFYEEVLFEKDLKLHSSEVLNQEMKYNIT